MHRIRQATNADRPALERVWLAAFPEDTPDDIDGFWASGFSPEQAWVYTIDDAVVSMAFLLPATLSTVSGERYAAGYLFAAATLPAFRGQGVFSGLIDAIHTHAAEVGLQAVFLRPAEESLFDFYRRFGYRNAFYTQEYTLTRSQMEEAATDRCENVRGLPSPSAVRQKWLQQRQIPSVVWDDSVWPYAVNAADGGRYWESPSGWMAWCTPDDDRLLVRELLCDDTDLPQVYAHLCREYAFKTCTIRRPTADTQAVFGMVKPLNPATAEGILAPLWYMGPALD